MPISEDHHDLFHSSNTLDKINFFRSLLDSQELTSMEALALLDTIHTELEQPQEGDRAVYARYAEMMEALKQKMPELHDEVVRKWSELQFILKSRQAREENKRTEIDLDVEETRPARKHKRIPEQKEPVKNKKIKQTRAPSDSAESYELSRGKEMEIPESTEEEVEPEEVEDDEPEHRAGEENESTEEAQGELEQEEEKENSEEESVNEESQEAEEERAEEKEQTEAAEQEGEEEQEKAEEENEEEVVEEGEEKRVEEAEQEGEETYKEQVEEQAEVNEAERMAMEAAESTEELQHAEMESEPESLQESAETFTQFEVDQPPIPIEEDEEGPPMGAPD